MPRARAPILGHRQRRDRLDALTVSPDRLGAVVNRDFHAAAGPLAIGLRETVISNLTAFFDSYFVMI